MFRLLKQGIFGATHRGGIDMEKMTTELVEAINMSKTRQVDDLKKALLRIDEIEMRYPGSLEYIRIPRGQIFGALVEELDRTGTTTSSPGRR